MDILIIIFLIFLSFLIAYLIFMLSKNTKHFEGENKSQDNERIVAMMERLNNLSKQNKDLRENIDRKLSETHKVSQDNIGKTTGIMQNVSDQTQKAMAQVHAQSQKIIQEVSEKLTKLDETNKQVVNFSAQLQNLQDILKNPKQRGVLGEYYLEETLKNVLPPNSYEMQYTFKDGSIVDAVVFVKEKIIPIDSKFSLENYERLLNTSDVQERERLEKSFKQDLKTRIDETSKYVKPGEKTMDFAFMFIPSEAIYYDLLVNKIGSAKVNTRDLVEYAFKDRHVIIVSPTSFLAYLQTVLQGLRALSIEESAKTIKHNVEKLSKHMNSYEEFMKKLGTSMSTTVKHYNSAYKEFKKVDKDVMKVLEGKSKVKPKILDQPDMGDE